MTSVMPQVASIATASHSNVSGLKMYQSTAYAISTRNATGLAVSQLERPGGIYYVNLIRERGTLARFPLLGSQQPTHFKTDARKHALERNSGLAPKAETAGDAD
jgi:hypothetical protein